MQTPPKCKYDPGRENKAAAVKPANTIAVRAIAVTINDGLIKVAIVNKGPAEKPEQNPTPSKMPIRLLIVSKL